MPQATSFDSLLTQCRDLVSDRLVQALTGMLDKADGALAALAGAARDPQVQKLYMVTRNKVIAQREAILTQFRLRYLREFQERGNRVKKIGESFADIDLSSLELELVADDDLNETLRINAMADRLREYCDEELVALDQRAGVLVGDADLKAEDNPFTPQAICDAYMRTCHQIDSNVEVRMVLLKLFDDYVLDEIRAIYKAVNALLVENSILPTIRSAGRQKRGTAPPAEAGSGAEKPKPAAPAGNRAPAGEQDLFSVLQNLVATNLKAMTQTGAAAGTDVLAQVVAAASGSPLVAGTPGATGGANSGHAALQGADLLQSLTRIQHGDIGAVTGGSLRHAPAAGEPDTTNVLRELKGTSLGADMNRMDAMTLDIVALLFDQLFDDPKIPIGVKGFIGRLQIPMLKVAIADKTFFSRKTHPARLMLDTLGELSSRLPADVNASNPLFGRMVAILQELSEGFENNVEIFGVMRERLQALITEEDQRVYQETQSAATQMGQQESLALAKTVAQAEIKVRIRDREVPRPVTEFLVQQWIKLLLVLHVKDGEDSDAWKNALETINLLILSVEPVDTSEERRTLVKMVPDLLKRLTEGLKTAGVEDAVRLGFFAEIRKLHSEIMGKTERSRAVERLDAEIADNVTQPESPAVYAPVVDASPVAEAAAVPMEASTQEPPPVDPSAPLPFHVPIVTELEAAPVEVVLPEVTPPVEPAISNPPSDLLSLGLSLVDEPAAAPVEAFRSDPAPSSEPAAPTPTLDPPSFDLPLVAAPEPAPREALRPVPTPTAEPAVAIPPFDLRSFELPLVAELASAAVDAVRPDPAPPSKPAAPTSTPDPSSFDLPLVAAPESAPGKVRQSVPAPPIPAAAAAPTVVHSSFDLPLVPPPAPAPREDRRPVPAPPAPPAAAAPTAVRASFDLPLVPPPAPEARKAVRPAPKPSAETPAPAPLDFTAAVTINNPFGQGEVQVDDLDFTVKPAGGSARAKRDTAQANPAESLTPGTWVAIQVKGEKNSPRLAKLSYVSPLKSRFLFVDSHGKTTLECTRTDLMRRLQSGELTITNEVPEVPLFDRLAAGLVGKLGGSKAPH